MRRRFIPLALIPLLWGCPDNNVHPPVDGGTGGSTPVDGGHDAPADAPVDAPVDSPVEMIPDASLPDGSILHPCELPGSVKHTAQGVSVVPGGPASKRG